MQVLRINNRYTYLSDYNLILDNNLKDIFLKHSNGKQVKQEKIKLDSVEIKNNIQQVGQLIFELTQDCNLRCKYCPHSGGFIFDRGRNESDMSPETALKGIDYIYSFIKDRLNKKIAISIYGGEPLLMFDLIMQIVRYAKEKFRIAESMLSVVEKVHPGIRDHIEEMEIATPLTHLRYLGHPKGSIYGFEHYLKNSTMFMPNRSSIKGFYTTGGFYG